MGTFNNSIQEKIEKLQKTVDTLLHMGENMDCICVDDLSLLNKEIHEQINDLYPYHGKTVEQEAALCLSLLMGYSVSMYANSEDEAKKKTVLRRSQMILKNQLRVQTGKTWKYGTENHSVGDKTKTHFTNRRKSTDFFEKRLYNLLGYLNYETRI